MSREDAIRDIEETLGGVPGWLEAMPDQLLEHQWGVLKWFLGDSALSGRDKALVAFGAASANGCRY